MAFKIGEIYRFSGSKDLSPAVDGLPNFFYETAYSGDGSSIKFQRGIHNTTVINAVEGSTRIPAIIISRSMIYKVTKDWSSENNVFQ